MYPQKYDSRRGYAKRQQERKEARRQAALGWKKEVISEENMPRIQDPKTGQFIKNDKPVASKKVVNNTTSVENTQSINPPKEGKMKTLWKVAIVIGTIILIVLCYVLGIAAYRQIKNDFASKAAPITIVVPTQAPIVVVPTIAPVTQPTSAAVQNSMSKVEVPTGLVQASEPNPTCPEWNTDKNVSQWLPPNQTVIGDVVVNGVPQYDNGKGEATVVVNLSTKNVDIFAEFGSGCEYTTDVQSVVDKQLFAGCGDSNNDGIVDGCDSVRIVLITDLGTEVKFVTPTVK